MRGFIFASAVVGAALWVAPAWAQRDDVDLTCRDGFISTTCSGTITRRSQPDDSAAWAEIGRARRERDAREEAATRAQGLALMRRDVFNLVQAGKCDTAQRVAVDAGDMTLAMQAREYCKPAPAEPMVVYRDPK